MTKRRPEERKNKKQQIPKKQILRKQTLKKAKPHSQRSLPQKQKKIHSKKELENRDSILDKYRNTVGTNSIEARALIKKLDYKKDSFLLQCIAQTYLDESLLEEDDSMRQYLNKRKWRTAEKYIIKAYKLNSDSPIIIYTMGKIRKAYNQRDIAIYCFKKIITQGLKNRSNLGFKTGISFIKELINDSKFELYRLYFDEGELKLANRYLSAYKKGLEKGINTIFIPLEKFLLP